MKIFMKVVFTAMLIPLISGCHYFDDYWSDPAVPTPEVTMIASGLDHPLGMHTDLKGWLWVAEAGTGNNDSRITLIKPDGSRAVVAENFASINFEGEIVGNNHIAIVGNSVFFLNNPEARLYELKISDWLIAGEPLEPEDINSQDIGSFALNIDYPDPTGETNPYGLTADYRGNLYIADAAANAIFKRERGSGELSVLAILPDLPNPLPIGPPTIDAVPTGITFRNGSLFVGTLLGFPFPEGNANIYEIELDGSVSLYQEGMTLLTDVEANIGNSLFATEFGRFSLETFSFVPNSGRLVQASKAGVNTVLDGLSTPTDVEIPINRQDVAYVNSYADGKIYKLKF